MAQKIKINNATRKRFAKSKKEVEDRTVTVYFLIVCEGEKTEPNYFRSFPSKSGKFIYDLSFGGGGISTKKVVEEAIRLRDNSSQKYDRVWAVFDKDSFRSEQFNGAIQKANANEIHCAWSNEAFEIWYLLHFHYRDTAMSRDEYKRILEKFINKRIGNKKFKYKKNSLEMYSILEKYGSQENALRWAEKLAATHDSHKFSDHNPSTTVYKLVKELIGKSKELSKEIMKKMETGQ